MNAREAVTWEYQADELSSARALHRGAPGPCVAERPLAPATIRSGSVWTVLENTHDRNVAEPEASTSELCRAAVPNGTAVERADTSP